MPPKLKNRWITALIAQSSQSFPALPWERAAKRARRKSETVAQRKVAVA
jgi:hypothetical protein